MCGIKVRKLFQNILITWFIEESCSLTCFVLCIILWNGCEVVAVKYAIFAVSRINLMHSVPTVLHIRHLVLFHKAAVKKVLKMWQYLGESEFLSPCWCIYCTFLCTLLSLTIDDALTSVVHLRSYEAWCGNYQSKFQLQNYLFCLITVKMLIESHIILVP
jgi:hypothetical protein